MPWYVIQTYTGGEEKLAEMIRRIVPEEYYSECFPIYAEQLRHRQQENQIHVLRLFPGYVFISSSDIEQLYCCLKKIPAMTKILTTEDFLFTPLLDEEAEFLLSIMDADHIVRLSYAATDGRDHVTYLSGPLEKCRAQIRSWKFRKRYAAVGLTIDGREKEVKLGIILNDDIRRETGYGKVEAPVKVPEKYSVWQKDDASDTDGRIQEAGTPGTSEQISESAENRKRTENPDQTENSGQTAQMLPDEKSGGSQLPQFSVGDQVLVMEGVFEGNVAAVSQVKRNVLRISVWLFGREIQAEVPAETVRKIG